MQNYSDKVMEHFRNPRNVGEMENPDGIGHVGNPVCILGDTLISCNSEPKPIHSIVVGDKVLSRDGNYHRVAQFYKRPYRGEVCHLKIQNLRRIITTPDHHILALKMGHLDRRYSKYKQFVPDWYCADELEKGDVILYPISKESMNVSTMKFDIPIPEWDFRSKSLPEEIDLSDDFLRLIGYYLAEGYTRTDKCKGTVGFVFGAGEREYVEEVIETMRNSFGITPAPLREVRNSIDVIFYSARLARFFCKHFGKGAKNKQLPHFMMTLPPERQRHIIAGVWRGDGYVSKNGAKFCTISRQLAHQVKYLLMRQKIVFSTLTVPRKGIHKENYHLYVKSIPSLRKLNEIVGTDFEWPDKKKNSLKAWYDDNFFYAMVSSKETELYNGDVFNLEVQDSHSYVSDSVCLHNCGDIMELYIKVEDNTIADAKFKTFGCGAAIATSSMVTELVKGKTIDEALKVSNNAVAEALGGLPPVKMHCSVLAEEALGAAIDDYLEKTKKSA